MTQTAIVAPAPGQLKASRAQGLSGLWRAIRTNRKATTGAVLLLIFTLVAIFPQVLAHESPYSQAFDSDTGPSAQHLLGTTQLGQDIWAQLIYGTRETLIVALSVGFLSSVLSVIVGVSAAYLGGLADGLLALITDVFLVIPLLPLLIIISAYLRGTGGAGLLLLVTILTVTGWSFGARQLRVQALSLRKRDFLESARIRGERRLYVIVVEMLPTMTSLIVAQFLGTALYAVLTAAGLQFLGLGDPSAISWGTMLYWAQTNEAIQSGIPLHTIAPGACIALLGAALALLNYAFDEISNPALRPVKKLRVHRTNP